MDTSQCLTDEFLAALVDGKLKTDERSRAHEHLVRCAECRALVAMVLRDDEPPADQGAPEPEAAAGWTPPDTFDEFRMIRPLGRGAMGVVYLAHDLHLDRQVAVKFIATARPDARARQNFRTEARAIARLQHPNVVTVFRVGEVQGLPYIVSEYLVGQSLGQISAPLSWRRVLSLGVGLARGLAAAHRQGVLHRDLKPANVFLTSSEEVKLLDFGLAELSNGGEAGGSRRRRSLAGTPLYMAPELFLKAPATPQSDLYSLGLVLYQLCTGRLPSSSGEWPGLEPRREELALSELSRPVKPRSIPPLSESVPGIDLDFASLIERCLRSEPEERFASAEVLQAELERLHVPLEASSSNPYRGLAPFEAEHRALFFGRDADVQALLARLRRQSLVLVAGDSGVGKSSLCRAGILSRVAQGALDEHRHFYFRVMEPGRWPLATLAAMLAPLLDCSELDLRTRLADSPHWLGSALRASHQEGRGLLLFIDQLEELITLSDPSEAASFASLLEELTLPSSGVRVLLAVRGDFLTRLGALPGLGDQIEQALYLLRPLSTDGVREAITGPARSRSVAFESEQLLHSLIEATAREVGGLPLLQFTLAELWERRDRARACITGEQLDKIGGVAGALSRHADDVIRRLDRTGQQVARQVFGLLITAEGTRCERSEEELTTAGRDVGAVLRVLVAGRLLHARAVEGRTSYEIAHEALITHWSTMRRWIDEGAGQRALRQRVEFSSSEWERAGQAVELLWRGRQLDEARDLDLAALGAREQLFLRASQRAVRRQRLLRWLMVLLFVAAVGAVYGGVRLEGHRAMQSLVHAGLEGARLMGSHAREFDSKARESRKRAVELFSAPMNGRIELMKESWSKAETEWALAREEFKQANANYSPAIRVLEVLLTRVPESPEVRKLLRETLSARFELAERFYLTDESERILEDLERLAADDARALALLHAPARLEVVTEPPGAKVEIERYEDQGDAIRKVPVPGRVAFGLTPMAQAELPAGSYHLRMTLEGRVPVDLPILLKRGEAERVELRLPMQVPENYIYIPPGCFLMGTADPDEVRTGALESAPFHRICQAEGYLIGRDEVTLGDWITYLDDPQGQPEAHRVLLIPDDNNSGHDLKLEKLPNGRWRFTIELPGGVSIQAQEGQFIDYPGRKLRRAQDWRRFPLAKIRYEDARGYMSWLDRTNRLKGARLCNEWEWTRAARGADQRRYPHGNRLQEKDANIDTTYGRSDTAYGPDEVGSHLKSVSPFGARDMAGNVYEMVQAMTAKPDSGELIQMGGAWYYPAFFASIAGRQPHTPSHRDVRIGFRVCASLPGY